MNEQNILFQAFELGNLHLTMFRGKIPLITTGGGPLVAQG
jgi:hypothetical protein